ncbi:MAG: MarR family transcriptional regulator for hemolysin, partial [Flavobacteriales bacterium]
AGKDITIDQWLVLKSLYDLPDITQQQIAEMVFKDYASVTRMIELLVKKGFIKRAMHPTDRRRFLLSVTKTGEKVITEPEGTIKSNRAKALKGISKKEIEQMNKTLNKIIINCTQ